MRNFRREVFQLVHQQCEIRMRIRIRARLGLRLGLGLGLDIFGEPLLTTGSEPRSELFILRVRVRTIFERYG